MVYIIISIICIIIAVICIIKLQNKQHLDKREKNKLEQDIQLLKHNKNTLQEDLDFCRQQLEKEQKRFKSITDENNRLLAQKAIELDEFYDYNITRRLEQLENEMERHETTAKELLQKNLEIETTKYNTEIENARKHLEQVKAELDGELVELAQETAFQHVRFESLLNPLKQYEKDRQEKLFYTVQVPEEFHEDISYLLTTVAQRVQHKDIISKLVWTEYIKPNMDETLKRVGIEDKPGIYKITSLTTGKCYIGKSTNVKKRLQDHFKSSIGITSIADQAIHHAILDEGVWNWVIEIITYCEKEQLNELEKYYIDFFKSQEFGYNKTGGG